MKAILLNEAGGVENLLYSDIAKPILKPGEVLVRVKAISINPADVLCRANGYALNMIMGEERPVILGWDISGEITETTDNVEGLKTGDNVFGMVEFFKGGKGYAEYVAVPAAYVALKPDNITHVQAAATTMAALTAWQPLQAAGVKKGDKVLIHGASGGVGHFAVQLAKYLGATVIATSSGKNRDFVLSLGADQHLDYNTQKFEEEAHDVDFVLNMAGGDTLERSIDVVRPGGRIISLVYPLAEELKEKAQQKGVDLSFMASHSSGKDLGMIVDLMSKGLIKVHISAIYPFAEMGKAHTQVESGHTVGKVVVTL